MALVNKSDEDIDYSDIPALVAKHGLTPNAAIFCQIQVSRAIKLSGGEHVVLFPPSLLMGH